jgi:CRISPR-associated protein Csh1
LIKNIYELGSYFLNEHPSFLEGLAVPVALTKGKEQYLVVIDLNTDKKKVELIPYQMSSKTYLDYRYIGVADGANSPQWYGTVSSKNVGYLLSQTITNLLVKWDPNDPFYKELKLAQGLFFENLGVKKQSEKRYQFVFNPEYFGGKRTEDDNKEAIKEVTKQLENYLREEVQLPPKDILLYSLSINGKLIVSLPGYEQLVIEEKFNVFDDQKGICAISNKEDHITGETTKLKFNYYINDKINFASNIDKNNYVKNMAIGKEAYKCIMVGESYIFRKFNTRFNSLPCLIIPEFLFDFNEQEDIPFDDFSTRIMNLVYTVQTLEEFEQLEREVEDYIDFSGIENHVTLNFLFYTKAQASMKVNKYLANIPANHLKRLQKKMKEIKDLGQNYYGKGHWGLGLNHLYYLIPMKEQRGENFEKRKILLLFESLLSNKALSYDWLIHQFLTLGKVHMYEQYGVYQVKESKVFTNDMQLVFDLLKAQLLLKMLYDLNLIVKGGNSPVDYQLNDEKLINYMNEMNYNEAQSSLFLLGVLIAKVGAAQVSKNESGQLNVGTSNKPILNKINFHGMNKIRLKTLSIEVFEKLRQYKRLGPTNELIYAEHKRLFDKTINKWQLSDRENVFYLLSGYAFGTKALLSSKTKKDEEEKHNE